MRQLPPSPPSVAVEQIGRKAASDLSTEEKASKRPRVAREIDGGEGEYVDNAD